jgi:hypothetical protein
VELRADKAAGTGSQGRTALREKRGPADEEGGRDLLCARCRRVITSEADRIAVDGLHEHTQVNPHGFIWSFGCFARAPGCVPVGPPSREFAWFAGHSWQVEECGGCRTHLGWLFACPDRSFHGLIVGRLVADDRR